MTDEEGHSGDKLVSVNMGEVEDVEEGAEGDEEGYSGDELMRHSGDEEHSEEEYNEESTEEESTEEEEEEEEDYPLRCNGPHHTTEVPRHTTPRRSTPPGSQRTGPKPQLQNFKPNFGVFIRCTWQGPPAYTQSEPPEGFELQTARAQRMRNSCPTRSPARSDQSL